MTIPQFHPKQKATVQANIYNGNKTNSSSITKLTYVGTDDTANFLSAMATILDNSKNTPKVNFRHDNKHDKQQPKFLKDWSKKL